VQKAGEWEYESVCSVPSPIYPPLQAVAHRARRFMPTSRAHHTQALTRGPRSCPSVGAGQQNGGASAQQRNVPHIPYARRPVGLRIMVMIASAPGTSIARRLVGSGIVVIIASGPVTFAA
jgi:hypothetical protein